MPKHQKSKLVEFLETLHPSRTLEQESEQEKQPKACVGAYYYGNEGAWTLKKARVGFSDGLHGNDVAKTTSDIVTISGSIATVALTVITGREYKDHLMKFIMLQLPGSFAAISMVLVQGILYKTVQVTAHFIFFINLIYLPVAMIFLIGERSNRYNAMMKRWRSEHGGIRTMTDYIKNESLKSSVFMVTVYQIVALTVV